MSERDNDEPEGRRAVKPRLLDLFCKAGGAGRGYADAGFEVRMNGLIVAFVIGLDACEVED